MPDDKNINLMKYWPIVVGIFMLVGTWTGIKMHISNDDIHLTEQQRNKLIEFTTITEDKLPTIKTNENRIIEIEKEFYGFGIRFDILYEEHEGLESKVSRNYIELNNKIE